MITDVPLLLVAHITPQTTLHRVMMNEVQTKEMISLPNPVVLAENVQELFDNLKEQNYHDEDMMNFINEYGQEHFFDRYEDYVEIGEEYNYDAVDAFIDEFGIQSFNRDAFIDSYQGEYESKADYAEQYVTDCYSVEIPGFVEVDWEATFDNMDEVFNNGFVFNNQF